VVQVDRREALIEHLAGEGIETKVHYPIPIHLQPPCRAMGYAPGDFPVCEAQSSCILSLPINEHLSDAQIEHVAASIRRFFTDHA
jgi:dTDP-4-amino-4,6-dideoxygalactose transaminase